MRALRTEFNSVDPLHTFTWSEGCGFGRAGDDAQEDIVIQGDETQTASCCGNIAVVGEIEGRGRRKFDHTSWGCALGLCIRQRKTGGAGVGRMRMAEE